MHQQEPAVLPGEWMETQSVLLTPTISTSSKTLIKKRMCLGQRWVPSLIQLLEVVDRNETVNKLKKVNFTNLDTMHEAKLFLNKRDILRNKNLVLGF